MTPAPPSPSTAPRSLSILGSTGSIGTQTLEVVRLFPDRFDVEALACGQNVDLVAEQAHEFRPNHVAVAAPDRADALRSALEGLAVEVHVGEAGMRRVATLSEVDVVVGAVVGFAGLAPVLAALRNDKQVALANKETLVVAGPLVQQALDEGSGTLLPVDSEHSAIFQCLTGESSENVEQVVLTASGGPFWARSAETFESITVEEALDHPNWSMGAKITIDSATMMNKGLEVIEARWLFDLEPEQIEVLVHPQSIVHSMVSFDDGAVKAQLGVPDMKVPIQYALSYPSRWPAPHERLDWSTLGQLNFAPPDPDKFPCLRHAYTALEQGGTAPAILNAANEAAVDGFLGEQVAFPEIPLLVGDALASTPPVAEPTLDDLYEADAQARAHVQELLPTPSN
ncbi:MAG: 1-deoxy-D-xylulose-5-phosphate reductoisomerase [Salinibacter sp.]